jgi:ABC-type transporter Mla maintaining outer membrane lipid asymmetry ATPase subunit MlaF
MSVAVEFTDVRVEPDGQLGVSFSVESGEFLALVGPTRSGKGRMLRLCAGLLTPVEGSVRVLGCDLADLSEEELIELRMRVGIVLQPPGLLSNMTVYNNVALPLRYHRGLPDEEIRPLVMGALEALGIASLWNRFPAELNQGETRCVAIARALIMDQELVLLDEPTDGMDADMTRKLGQFLASHRQSRPLTILATLHAFSPLLESADRVAFVRGGRIEAIGSHAELVAKAGPGMKDYLG